MNTNIKKEYYPIELLHWAGMNDSFLGELINILKKHPEYINVENLEKDNALIIASRMDNQLIVNYLINNTEINLNHSVKEGNALSVAAEYNRKEIVKILLTTSINIEQRANNGWTPIFYAAKNGNDEIIELLLNKNVNINILDNEKQNIFFTFMDHYLSHKNYYAFELLLEKIDNTTLFTKDVNGNDIIAFMNNLIQKSRENNNRLREEKLIKLFDPLFHILEHRK